MAEVKDGDTVKVHYTGTLEDGTVFDSSKDRDPLEFTVGAQQVIPGFEQMVQGMNAGESKKETIPVDFAYGQARQELVLEVDKTSLPADIPLEPGLPLQLSQADGSVIPVVIGSIAEDKVVLDANHPLAGKDLTFEIELVEIV